MEYTRVNNDINGNPRYVFHFFAFLNKAESYSNLSVSDKYELALKKSRAVGGKKYHNKSFGGGIAIQSYNIGSDIARIHKIASKPYKK